MPEDGGKERAMEERQFGHVCQPGQSLIDENGLEGLQARVALHVGDTPPVAMVPLSLIEEHADNWHIHPPEQLEEIRRSFEEFGPNMDASDFNVRTGRLLDGHARITLLRERNIDVLYCQLHDLSPEDENRWLLTKDKTASMALTDTVKLKLLMEPFALDDNLPAGWSTAEWEDILTAGAAELEKMKLPETGAFEAPGTAPCRTAEGEIWQVGPHIVACGDGTDVHFIAKLLDRAGVDRVQQIFTDPPYEITTTGGPLDHPDGCVDRIRGRLTKIRELGLDKFDPVQNFLPSLTYWLGGLDCINVFLYCPDGLQLPVMQWAKQNGATWATLFWWKHRGDPFGNRHECDVEPLLWLRKRATWNERSTLTANRSRILEYPISEEQKKGEHPTPKSCELAMNEIMLTTASCDWICDPYCGTGPHGVAAALCGRNAILVDRDPRSVDFALAWMEIATEQKARKLTHNMELVDVG